MKKLLAAAFTAVSLAGCTVIQSTTVYSHEAAKVPAESVKVFHLEKELPARFTKVATFEIDYMDNERAIARAKRKAGELGANGLYAGGQTGYGFGVSRSVREFIAIRF